MMVNSVCGTGSTGRIVAELYHAMENAGHTCCVAYGRGDAPKGMRTIKIGCSSSVYVHGIINRVTDKHGFYSRRATERFIKELEEWKPDLIHLHNIHGYYLHIGLLFQYLQKKRIPVVWTLHDCWAMTGHCAYFDRVGCERWKTECFRCPQKHTYPESWFQDRSRWNYRHKKQLFRGLDHVLIITPSKWLANMVRQSYLKKYPIRTIYNGIDLECFKPIKSDFRKKYGLYDRKIVLGVANTWELRKGLQCFIELSKILDPQYQIVMVGINKRQMREMPENILALPRTDSLRELAEIYTAADVFLSASIEETMGLVTVEALACGTPVIAFNRTAIPETFDGSCGILINVNKGKDVRQFDLAESVKEVLQNGQWLELRNEDCRAFTNRFDKHNIYQQYITFLEEQVQI